MYIMVPSQEAIQKKYFLNAINSKRKNNYKRHKQELLGFKYLEKNDMVGLERSAALKSVFLLRMVHFGWQLAAGANKLLSKSVVLWCVDTLLAIESLRPDARA